MNKWNGTDWDKISGEAQDFDYNSLTNKPSINGTTLQGNVVFDFITEDDLSELNTLIDELEARIDNIENGTKIVPNANSSFYSFVANSATNAHLVDGKEISEWTAGTVWTCTYNNGAITLPEGKTLSNGMVQPIQFIAPTAGGSGTSLTVGGTSATIVMQDGSAVPETLWGANSVVFAIVYQNNSGAITVNFKSGGGGISLDPLENPAVAANILTGKEVYNDQGEKITGSMAEYSTAQTGGTPTTDGTNVTTPVTLSGYYTTESGLIVPKSTVLGVVLPNNTTATASDILYGETAYDRNGNLLTGTIRSSTGEQGTVANIDITPDTSHSTYGNITSNGNYKIALTPGLNRYVDSTASWPTYINVNTPSMDWGRTDLAEQQGSFTMNFNSSDQYYYTSISLDFNNIWYFECSNNRLDFRAPNPAGSSYTQLGLQNKYTGFYAPGNIRYDEWDDSGSCDGTWEIPNIIIDTSYGGIRDTVKNNKTIYLRLGYRSVSSSRRPIVETGVEYYWWAVGVNE